jgi:outer membrane protein assembly factor BamA
MRGMWLKCLAATRAGKVVFFLHEASAVHPFERIYRLPWIIGLLALLLVRPGMAQVAENVDPTPLVEDLKFEGVKSVDVNELRATLHTEETRCRLFILQPICSLTHNHLFEKRVDLDREQLKRDLLRVRVFYWLRGFRHAQVDTAVTPRGRGVRVLFRVAEGPPTLIDTVTVTQLRESLSMRSLRRWGLPSKGDRIDLTRRDSLRVRVNRELWDKGRGNAEFRDTVTLLDSLSVALAITIDAGPVTTVDTVVVEGNEKVSDRTVQRLVGMRPGDLYKRSELLAAQRRMFRSDLFRQMMITSPDSADSAKTILVGVREAPMRAAEFGGGINTVEFGQLQANLTLYNFHGSARRVSLHSAVGNLFASSLYGKLGSSQPVGVTGDPDPAFLTPTWQVSASLTQPWFFSTRNSVGLTAFSNRRSVPSIVIDRGSGVSATFTRTLMTDIPLSFTYRFERARIEAGELYFCVGFGYCSQPIIQTLRQTNNFSPFIVTLRADRTDDPLMPTSGYTIRFDAEHASAVTGSDWRFNRFEADVTPYLKFRRGSLAIRGHAGWVKGSASTLTALQIEDAEHVLLHPRVRFYGGGARSVRGYGEGQLGPRVLTIDPAFLINTDTASNEPSCTYASVADGTCDPNVAPSSDFVARPVGGRALLEGTIEYRFPLFRNVGGAVFVDAGHVGSSELDVELPGRSAITPGVGFRYLSPIGPVRVDLGWRPKRVEELRVVTQTGDSITNLRLVNLAIPKRYDETEGQNSFLAKLTSRLQLHLYIGEAY